MIPGRIGVILPAHDEQALIGSALRALAAAARRVSPPVHLVVVLDDCRDATAEVVAASDRSAFTTLDVMRTGACRVGAARRAGAHHLLDVLPVAGTWLATTDADSAVPRNWFERQLAHAAAGADAVAGTVSVGDWSGVPDGVPEAYRRRYTALDGHRHVHGANLSLRAAVYLDAGGFPAVETDEDVALIEAVGRRGHRVLWAGDLAVTTSARLRGRAPGGFADHLAALT